MSATRVTDQSTCASTINIEVKCTNAQVVVVVEVDRARDQRAVAEPDRASDEDDDRSQDCEINEATHRRWAQRYGAGTIPATDPAWARWRALRREVKRDLDARLRHRFQTRAGCSHIRAAARPRARAARRVVRTAKSSTDDDGGEGDGGEHEGGAL